MHMIHSLQQALGGSSPQAMFHYVAVFGGGESGWENKPELTGLHVILFLLMLLQAEGDTSLGSLNNNMKSHLITLLKKCGNYV